MDVSLVCRVTTRRMSCIITILQPIVVVKQLSKSLNCSDFLAFAMQRYAITASKQLTMRVSATSVIVDPLAVTNIEAVFGAVPPDGALHEPRKRLGKSRIEFPGVDVGGNQANNICTAAQPVAPVAVEVVAWSRFRTCRCRKLWTRVSTAMNVAPTSRHNGRRFPAARIAMPTPSPTLVADAIDVSKRANNSLAKGSGPIR